MAIARVLVKHAGEVLAASEYEAEFNNILNNATSLISPLTASLDGGGFNLTNLAILTTTGAITGGTSIASTTTLAAGTSLSSGTTLDVGTTITAGSGNIQITTAAGYVDGANLAIASQAIGDILQASSTTAWARLGSGTAGFVLTAGGAATVSAWAQPNAAKLLIASQAIGDVLYASSTTAWARLGTGTVGQLMTAGGAGAAPSWTSPALAKQAIFAQTSAGPNATTIYFSPAAPANATEATIYAFMPLAGTLKNLYVYCSVTPGGGTPLTVYARLDAANTALTCVVTNPDLGATDLIHTAAVTAGQVLTFSAQCGGNISGSTLLISIEFDPS